MSIEAVFQHLSLDVRESPNHASGEVEPGSELTSLPSPPAPRGDEHAEGERIRKQSIPPPPPHVSQNASSPSSSSCEGGEKACTPTHETGNSTSSTASPIEKKKKGRRRSSIGYDDGRKGCTHYKRRSSLVAACCGELFACRFCHDEFHETKSPILTRKKNVEGMSSKIATKDTIHTMNRHEVQTIVCMECGHEQAPAQDCELCGIRLGKYFCEICNFFDDDDSKGQFHCDKCGICRVGGKENYFHCDTCGCCFAKSLKDNHKCIERSMHQNCPVCQEFLFSSTKGGVVMECGHVIHGECFDALVKSRIYKCPLCNKSILSEDGKKQQNAAFKQAINENPMPEEYRGRIVNILCNDCESKSQVNFHFVGMECSHCGSFNTSQV